MQLPPQKFVAWREGKIVEYEWQPPDIADDATSHDLANIHSSFWDWIIRHFGDGSPEAKSRPQISLAALARLLRLAFLASLTTDEQRPTHGRLYVATTTEVRFVSVARLARPEALHDESVIGKLCPTLDANDAALIVDESDGQLRITDIAHLDSQNATYDLGRPPRDWMNRRGGILIEIVAPGEIRLRQGYCDYTLRRNRVFGRVSASSVPQVREWMVQQHQTLYDGLPENVRDHRLLLLDRDSPDVLETFFERVLQTAAALHHGGTVLVLNEPLNAPLTIKYPTQGNDSLCQQIGRFYRELVDATDNRDILGGSAALARFEQTRHQLLVRSQGWGRLTATDGAVVFDRQLRLQGFGGIIDVDRAREQGSLPLITPHILEEDLLRRFGTRHRSTFYLCRAWPNSLAFVISQDGDVRVFSSDANGVRFVENLCA